MRRQDRLNKKITFKYLDFSFFYSANITFFYYLGQLPLEFYNYHPSNIAFITATIIKHYTMNFTKAI